MFGWFRKKQGYDMQLGFITKLGTVHSNSESVTIDIPVQDYKYVEIKGDFQKILPVEWIKINKMEKNELNCDYCYDLEMYSEDYKTVTLAVSVNKWTNYLAG